MGLMNQGRSHAATRRPQSLAQGEQMAAVCALHPSWRIRPQESLTGNEGSHPAIFRGITINSLGHTISTCIMSIHSETLPGGPSQES